MYLFAIITIQRQKQFRNYWDYSTIIPIALFSLIIGLRYDVGVDYLNYLELYKYGANFDKKEYIEPVYLFFNEIFKSLNLHYSSIFIFSSFLIITFIYAGSRGFYFILPQIIYFIFTTGFIFHSMNIIRFSIGFSIFYFALSYINKKKIFNYMLLSILAVGFHKSFILTLPMYFILRYDLFQNKKIQYLLIITSNIVGQYLIGYLLDYTSVVMAKIGYQNYLSNADLYIRDIEIAKKGYGLLNLATLIIVICIIHYSDKLKSNFNKNGFIIYYNLFIIGQLLFPIVSGNIIFERLIYLFYFFNFIVFSFATHYFVHYSKKRFTPKMIAILIYGVYGISFLISIMYSYSKCSPFQFCTF